MFSALVWVCVCCAAVGGGACGFSAPERHLLYWLGEMCSPHLQQVPVMEFCFYPALDPYPVLKVDVAFAGFVLSRICFSFHPAQTLCFFALFYPGVIPPARTLPEMLWCAH
jgi:hypothetical protein